ncbi:hypothetical protein [Flavobacterium sp.]|jgi:hypothetical protein|uniref:hypothetical protein n=1 Tax=Flavobacterium sp. TaxID=239 RepID=UPI0037BEF122
MINKGTKIVENQYLEDVIKSFKNDNLDILIIGECEGEENVIQTVLKCNKHKEIQCVDILPLQPNSSLEKLVNTNNTVKFTQTDFIKNELDKKYDIIVCISVLEHFGMRWNGEKMFDKLDSGDDDILWNYDLVGLLKMGGLLKDKDSKAIITLPVGPYMNYLDNGLPFLRYYDIKRMNIFDEISNNNNLSINDEIFYYTQDFQNFEKVAKDIAYPEYNGYINSYTPNCIWAFNLQQK